MRKGVLFLCLLMLLSFLPAQVQVPSNSIGQERGYFDESSDYNLMIEADTKSLYHHDALLWQERVLQTSTGKEVITLTKDGVVSAIRIYEGNRLVSFQEKDQERLYYYDESGALSQTMLLVGGVLSEMELYSYDGVTGRLAGIFIIEKEGNSLLYFSSQPDNNWFSSTSEGTFTKMTQVTGFYQAEEVWQGDTPLVRHNVDPLDDGGMLVTTSKTGIGEEKVYYNQKGLLIRKTTSSFDIEYRYTEDGSLSESIERTDKEMKHSIYEEGSRVSESWYVEGILEKVSLFPAGSGRVDTLYDKGVPYCDITYALDGERVLSIRYR